MTTPKSGATEVSESPDVCIQKHKLLADVVPEAFSEGKLDVAALKRALGEGGGNRGRRALRAHVGGKIQRL